MPDGVVDQVAQRPGELIPVAGDPDRCDAAVDAQVRMFDGDPFAFGEDQVVEVDVLAAGRGLLVVDAGQQQQILHQA